VEEQIASLLDSASFLFVTGQLQVREVGVREGTICEGYATVADTERGI